MKLHNTHDNIVLSGVTPRHFNMKASAKAFSILSSTMYKNPILAIVRELSCNAYDAHIAAGTLATPFDVHVPNAFEPHFSIRDYGTGLSEDQINTIYTTYFESTKSDSDDYVGALGLGSKSPFSYADSFTIVSNYNGTQLSFAAFIGSDGIPSIAKLHEAETSNPNGLEISFAVKHTDIAKFANATRNFFSTWTSVSPHIVGSDGNFTTIQSVERGELSGTNWFIDSSSVLNHAIVIQGNVPYPIHVESINTHECFTSLSTQVRKSINSLVSTFPLVIVVPIGKLDFAASREELQYTELTIKSLVDELVKASTSLCKLLVNRLVNIESLWEAKLYVSQCRNRYTDVFRVVSEDREIVTKSGLTVEAITKSSGIYVEVRDINKVINSQRLMYIDGRVIREVDTIDPNSYITFVPSTKFKLIVNDLGTQGMARIREKYIAALTHLDSTHIYIITGNARAPIPTQQGIDIGANFAKLLTYNPASVIFASDLPEVKHAPKDRYSGAPLALRAKIAKGCVRVFNVGANAELSSEIDIDFVNDQRDIKYVVVRRGKYYDPITNTTCNATPNLIRYCVENKIVDVEMIVAVTPATMKKVHKKWKSLWVHAADSNGIQNFVPHEYARAIIANNNGVMYRSTFLDLVYKGGIDSNPTNDINLAAVLDMLGGSVTTNVCISMIYDRNIVEQICKTAYSITQDPKYSQLTEIGKSIASIDTSVSEFTQKFTNLQSTHPIIRFIDKGAFVSSNKYSWDDYVASATYVNARVILIDYFNNLK